MCLLLIAILFFVSDSLGQQIISQREIVPKSPTETNVEALILIQGHTKDGFIDIELIEEINEGLRAIRSHYPEMENILARHRFSIRSLNLELSGKARKIIKSKVKKKSKKTSDEWEKSHNRIHGISFEEELGIGEIDELNTKYGVESWSSNIGLDESSDYLTLNFNAPMDIWTLKDIYSSLPMVERVLLDPSIGDGDEIFFLPRGDSLLFAFKHGWGDCPSGCINNHYYYYTYVKSDHNVIKEGELPPDRSRSDEIYRLSIPKWLSVSSFTSFEDIKNKAKSSIS